MVKIIIQARVGSSRLPGKVLMKNRNKTMLEIMVERVNESKYADVIVATTNNPKDDKIVEICKKNKIQYFRGDENNVLSRYYILSSLFPKEHIVRLTSDCPLMDPKLLDKVIDYHFYKSAGFTTNVFPRTFPDGLDIEIFAPDILGDVYKKVDRLAEHERTKHQEHVTSYIYDYPTKFEINNFLCDINLSYLRWTLDTLEDFNYVSYIFDNLGKESFIFNTDEILDFLDNGGK